jgi:RNA polymerase sigma factor (sigma-70 family)
MVGGALVNREGPPDSKNPDEKQSVAEGPGEAPDDISAPAFEERLKIALQEAFPVLLDRLTTASFADWHRRLDLIQDLAQASLLGVFRHCKDRHVIPDSLVGYLVATARNLAIAAWKERRNAPLRFADLQRIPAKPGTRNYPDAIDFNPVPDDPAENDPEAEEQDDDLDTASDRTNEGRAPENLIAITDTDNTRSPAIRRMRTAMDSLPRRQHEAIEIYMQHKDEMTFRQMGRMMGISADGFEKNVERAVKALRKHFA